MLPRRSILVREDQNLTHSGRRNEGFQKMGIPFRQMHSWDYSGPYHGYDGFAIFARDMDIALSSPVWSKLTPPWKTAPASAEEKKAA